MERLRLGGIGSGKMSIAKKSPRLYSNRELVADTEFGNIELRPKGIIVYFTERQERFAWLIPYYTLHIYNSKYYSIHSEGNFIQFNKNKFYSTCKKFLSKMMEERGNTLSSDYYGTP